MHPQAGTDVIPPKAGQSSHPSESPIQSPRHLPNPSSPSTYAASEEVGEAPSSMADPRFIISRPVTVFAPIIMDVPPD
ncbi:MAG: hypothetical protein Q9194_001169 [Teloschistes cf. exilis]